MNSKAWYDFTQDEFAPDKNYWVFHGCDGAGLQTGDCMGDLYYVENIFNACGPWGSDGCACIGDPSEGLSWTDYSGYGQNVDHNQCPFIHPVPDAQGVYTVYTGYHCGWYKTGGGWSDDGKPWFDNLRPYLKNGGETGGHDTMMLYPWVCTYDATNEFSWYHSGELYDYDNHIKCWCDNEPAGQGTGHDATAPPPAIYAYFMGACDGESDCIEATCANIGGCGSKDVIRMYSNGFTPW